MGKGRKILIGCGVLLALAFAAFVALMVYIGRTNSRAHDNAEAFCAGVSPGASLASVQEAAHRHPARPIVNAFEDQHEVRFGGVLLFSAVCRMTVVDDKVATTQFAVED